MATLNDANPYVGPRTFTFHDRSKFFGRDREARELTAFIISNRLVLFYAPSGAGKSSLLNTKIRPALTAEGTEVLPMGRVSGFSGDEVTADNIYVYNLLLSLHQPEATPPPFETLEIAPFLDNLVHDAAGRYRYDPDFTYPPDAEFKPRVLVIDQFEELLTTNPARWQERADFLKQLAAALDYDNQLWVVLSMREDFVARLDPYLHLLPDRLRYRYHMERLTRPAALEAIHRPAQAAGRPFVEEAAHILVDNLRRIRAVDGDENGRLDQFVEPVQLQAVCYQMWEKLRERPGERITVADVERFADVDTALTNFYEDTIASTVDETGVAETALRAWFEQELITEAGTRNMVFRGDEMTGSLPTPVADHVREQFILREVVRPGGTWYELVHDRFVGPIVMANQAWRQEHPLIQLAHAWDDGGRRPDQLLSKGQLERIDESRWRALGPLVNDFVTASQEAAADELRRVARFRRRVTLLFAVLLGLALIGGAFAVRAGLQARRSARQFATVSAQSLAEANANATEVARWQVIAEDALQSQSDYLQDQLEATPEPTSPATVPTATSLSSGGTVLPANPTRETIPEATTTATPTPAGQQAVEEQLNAVYATQTAVARPGGYIVFDSNRGRGLDIYIMEHDSGTIRQLTEDVAYQGEADLSSDSRFIAYETLQDDVYTIMLMRNDGSGRSELVDGRLPDWSPDDRFIAYETTTSPSQLAVVEVATGETTLLTDGPADKRAPSWSPDGRRIVYMTEEDGTWQLAILNVASGTSRIITDDDVDKRFPVWSPDGALIAYNTLTDDGAADQVWITGPAGEGLQQLTELGRNGRPAWSPDGRFIVFNGNRDGRWLIFRMNRDGSNQFALTDGDNDSRPDWGP